jgi:hypothetical protein
VAAAARAGALTALTQRARLPPHDGEAPHDPGRLRPGTLSTVPAQPWVLPAPTARTQPGPDGLARRRRAIKDVEKFSQAQGPAWPVTSAL